jgi:hypothetical protein
MSKAVGEDREDLEDSYYSDDSETRIKRFVKKFIDEGELTFPNLNNCGVLKSKIFNNMQGSLAIFRKHLK